MTDLHKAARQALEALELAQTDVHWELNSPTRKFLRKAEKNLRAALAGPVEPVPQPGVWMHPWPPVKAQQAEPKGGGRLPPPLQAEPDLSLCPQCNGPADNGHDRSIPPSPYLCTKCMAEMPQPSYNATVVDDAHPNGIPLEQWQNKPVQEPDHTYKLIGCVQHDCKECQRRTQRKPLTGTRVADAIRARGNK